mmetsp:Transcript_10713/g.30130  ORF Transcript_10713/g.30130 Transcript_10713/m.30130 type:complete len:364 (-) Transcript_10713:94-1185(-)
MGDDPKQQELFGRLQNLEPDGESPACSRRVQTVCKIATQDSHLKDMQFFHEWKNLCAKLCRNLSDILTSNRQLLTERPSRTSQSSENFTSRSTVGIMLLGVKVETTLIGGPSFGLLERGDYIVMVDGAAVTPENVSDALRGCDIPGSPVNITVERTLSGCPSPDSVSSTDKTQISIQILRMAISEIADRRHLFELFTFLETRAAHYDDEDGSAAVTETIELWTRMCKVEAERQKAVMMRYDAMVDQCVQYLTELQQVLDQMPVLTFHSSILGQLKTWVQQAQIVNREQVRMLITKVDALRSASESAELVCSQQRGQLAALEEWKQTATRKISAARQRVLELQQDKDRLSAAVKKTTRGGAIWR